MADIVRLKAPGGAEQLELAQIELPPPAAGEIRLRQTAIGVNFIDIYQRLGLYVLPDAKIPGVEAVGVVSAVGADVNGLNVGDRIAYAGAPVGAYASERNLPAWRAVKLPGSLSDEVVVLSAGPASRIIARHVIDLPRPRNLMDIRTEPRFAELYREIWAELKEEVLTSYAR